MKYFNWNILGIIRHQLRPIFSELFRGNFYPIFRSGFINSKSGLEEIKSCLKEIDKSTTAKVIEMGRNDR